MWLQGCTGTWDRATRVQGSGLTERINPGDGEGSAGSICGAAERDTGKKGGLQGWECWKLGHTLAWPWPDGFCAELQGHLGPSGHGNSITWSWGSCRPQGLTPHTSLPGWALVTTPCG